MSDEDARAFPWSDVAAQVDLRMREASADHASPHPGVVLKTAVEATGLCVEAFARHLGLTTGAIRHIIAGRADISVKMALLLSRALGTTPHYWLTLQMLHDTHRARTRMGSQLEAVPRMITYCPPSPTSTE